MDTAMLELIRGSGQFWWLPSPLFLSAAFVLLAVVLTGLPGRLILSIETRMAVRDELGRTAPGD